MATIDTIKSIITDELNMDASTVDENTVIESLDVDSLDVVELICELEEREGVEFGDSVEGINTIGDLVAYVDSLKNI